MCTFARNVAPVSISLDAFFAGYDATSRAPDGLEITDATHDRFWPVDDPFQPKRLRAQHGKPGEGEPDSTEVQLWLQGR
jgi:hypothetical protein